MARSKKPLQTDIAIVGAGPAGASLALLCAAEGFEVTLIDGRPDGPARPDGRNFAIVRGSWHLLEATGITKTLLPDAQPLNGLEATDGGKHYFGQPSVLFANDDLGDAGLSGPLGYMVEAKHLTAALDAAVKAENRVKLLKPALFEAYEEDVGGVTLTCDGGDTVRARVLIGCDGVNSAVRTAAGIPVEGRTYGKSVFAANVQLDTPHKGIARQLFTPVGPFATLPMTGDRANLAWYLPSGGAEAIAAMPKDEVEAELNARFEGFAGKMTLVSEPISYPLHLKIADRMTDGRVALVGDAARRINPLAGQGLNLGFKDVGALVEVMVDARRAGLDIGAGSVLQQYQQWRRFDSNSTAMAMDGIDRAFSNDNPALKPLRGLALMAASKIGPIRRAMTARASGDGARMPKLLRGETLA